MKVALITLILVASAIAPLAGAQADSGKPPTDDVMVIKPDTPTTPDSSQDPLNVYQEQMAQVTVETYAELVQIAQAVGAGQIGSERAEYLTRRSYEVGIVRLQFLDTLYQIAVAALAKGSPAKTEEQPSEVTTSEETLVVAPPNTSADIPESVAKYLALTPAQIAGIQARIVEERRQIQPLLQQLSQNRKALTMATHTDQSGNTQIRKLAIEQSHILEQLIIANSRLEREVYEMLSVEQRKKLATSAPGMLTARDSW